ncbi:MAG TPA: hypothetical protein VKX25_21770 [Bryobacteraceae bacterium]|jgi:flagellar motor protein MotB|nr:hypothetical protein [Bryobacteraceae bacterium]
MGFLDKFNVKKQIETRMQDAQQQQEELMNLDPSDPEAVRRLTEERNARIEASMPGWLKKAVPPAQFENVRRMQEQAIQKQAEMYRKLGEKKENEKS